MSIWWLRLNYQKSNDMTCVLSVDLTRQNMCILSVDLTRQLPNSNRDLLKIFVRFQWMWSTRNLNIATLKSNLVFLLLLCQEPTKSECPMEPIIRSDLCLTQQSTTDLMSGFLSTEVTSRPRMTQSHPTMGFISLILKPPCSRAKGNSSQPHIE